ncbi:MAG: hypothetical protein HKL80_10875 [Acidimicrobiales bacterium]|nr:hypothetical protein [Acidimicrobiales bacterium]
MVAEDIIVLFQSLRRALLATAHLLEDGGSIAIVKELATVSPGQAAKLIGVSRQYIDRLLSKGVLTSSRIPGSSYRQILVKDVLALVSSGQIGNKAIQDIVLDAVNLITNVCNPRTVFLFGSFARGDERNDSDIDLLIIVDDDTDSEIAERAVLRAVSKLATEVDVVVTSQSRLDIDRDSPGTLARRALREGRIVHTRAA